jgi:formiminotetrahydrofolate cyclodeaminase
MDTQEHASLLALQSAVHADIKTMAACHGKDKAKTKQIQASIKDKMSRMRTLTRDLELLVEEDVDR